MYGHISFVLPFEQSSASGNNSKSNALTLDPGKPATCLPQGPITRVRIGIWGEAGGSNMLKGMGDEG